MATTTSVTYRYSPVPFTAVQVNDAFWSPRLKTNRAVTIPYDFRKCEDTGRIDQLRQGRRRHGGDHEGIFFNDSDVYKIIEGAAYSLMLQPDPDLDAYLDTVIEKIARGAGAGRLSLHGPHDPRTQWDRRSAARRPRGQNALVASARQPRAVQRRPFL